MKNNKLLIVEDDPNLGKILKDYFFLKGYEVTLAIDGNDGFKKFSSQRNKIF